MVVLGLTSAPAVLAAALLPGVRALDGGSGTREVQGLVALGLLVATGVIGGIVVARTASSGPRQTDPWGAGRTVARVVLATTAVGAVALFTLTALQRHGAVVNPSGGAINGRLTSLESNRGDFWRVARTTFRAHPVAGVGSGGFQTAWLKRRTIPYAARDAHSLYFETPAELGVVGLALLLAFLTGVGWSAVRAVGIDRTASAGLSAVVLVWAVHAGLDWDWELPGVTLPALVAAAGLLAIADGGRRRVRPLEPLAEQAESREDNAAVAS